MIILDTVSPYTPGVFVSSNVPETDAPPVHDLTKVYAAGDKALDPATHIIHESKVGARAAVTISIGSPALITWNAHGLAAGTPTTLTTTGALPTGAAASTVYYVLAPTVSGFNLAATPGGAAIITTGTQSGVHTATASANYNRPLSDKTCWLKGDATNRWKMLDGYNNTQTEYPEEIVLELKPNAIAQALYLGNLDATEVEITATDPISGVVFSETASLIIGNSRSSFFGWLFNRIRRRRQFCTLSLPLYYSQTVTIKIRNPGALAKCGMCCIGPLEDAGLSEYGLAAETKDYSTTKFNFDGTSETTVRGYSKRMTVDTVVNNSDVDVIHERLLDFRQKTVVFIGAREYDLSLICGTYSGYKVVVASKPQSKISWQIDGKV